MKYSGFHFRIKYHDLQSKATMRRGNIIQALQEETFTPSLQHDSTGELDV
jgi:hypothetical protein